MTEVSFPPSTPHSMTRDKARSKGDAEPRTRRSPLGSLLQPIIVLGGLLVIAGWAVFSHATTQGSVNWRPCFDDASVLCARIRWAYMMKVAESVSPPTMSSHRETERLCRWRRSQLTPPPGHDSVRCTRTREVPVGQDVRSARRKDRSFATLSADDLTSSAGTRVASDVHSQLSTAGGMR